jgi:hypothetical protein
VIELPPGALVHPQIVRALFTEEREIWQYQVIQEGPARFRVDLVAAQGCDRPGTAARIARGFTERFSPDVAGDVRFVDEAARTAQGKVRVVLSMRHAGSFRAASGTPRSWGKTP